MLKQFSQFVYWIGLGETKVIYCQNTMTVYYCIFFFFSSSGKTVQINSFTFLFYRLSQQSFACKTTAQSNPQKIKWFIFRIKKVFHRSQGSNRSPLCLNEAGNLSLGVQHWNEIMCSSNRYIFLFSRLKTPHRRHSIWLNFIRRCTCNISLSASFTTALHSFKFELTALLSQRDTVNDSCDNITDCTHNTDIHYKVLQLQTFSFESTDSSAHLP